MAEKKTTTKKIRVTLVRSAIGYNADQRRTVEALGLNKINSSKEIIDTFRVSIDIFILLLYS